ncbi:MAG: AIM24 family protein, partial [Tissierellia bacterium]|nr:AIM24 family protein [Tissierellia bacterium]
MEGQRIIAQKSAYLASEVSVEFETVFTKRFSSGLLGGEG